MEQVHEESSAQESQNAPSSQTLVPTGVVDFEGEIGYWRNEREFISLTNYSIECVGYVTRGGESDAEGFLFEAKQKSNTDIGQKHKYYITWRDMSLQSEILKRMKSKKLWTSSNGLRFKQEFLPQYMKAKADEYLKEEGAKKVHPVELYGLQPGSNPPLWVLSDSVHIKIEENGPHLVLPGESDYAVLDNLKLPKVEIQELDDGKSLREMLQLLREVYGEVNCMSALLVVGGVALSTHFCHLGNKMDFSPIVAIGSPVTAKSTAVKAAFSIYGNVKAYEGTAVGLLTKMEQQTLPIWWEDPDDFKTLERVSVSVFNKVERTTFRGEHSLRAMPVVTLNPEAIFKPNQDRKKTLRTISRLTFIPFLDIENPLDLTRRIEFGNKLSEMMSNLPKSVWVFLGLQSRLESALTRPNENTTLQNVQKIVEGTSCSEVLDLRSKMSYAMLFYSTAKILEMLNSPHSETFFEDLDAWCKRVLVPKYKSLKSSTADSQGQNLSQPAQDDVIQITCDIIKNAVLQSGKALEFIMPKSTPTGCGCGEVVSINLTKAATVFPGLKGKEAKIRFTINTNSQLGCTKKKANFVGGQLNCIHIRRNLLPENLVKTLDAALKPKTGLKKYKDTEEVNADYNARAVDELNKEAVSGDCQETDTVEVISECDARAVDELNEETMVGDCQEKEDETDSEEVIYDCDARAVDELNEEAVSGDCQEKEDEIDTEEMAEKHGFVKGRKRERDTHRSRARKASREMNKKQKKNKKDEVTTLLDALSTGEEVSRLRPRKR